MGTAISTFQRSLCDEKQLNWPVSLCCAAESREPHTPFQERSIAGKANEPHTPFQERSIAGKANEPHKPFQEPRG